MRTQYKHAHLLIATTLILAASAFAQEPPKRRLSIEDIRHLLKAGVKEPEIIEQIQRYKVDFSLNTKNVPSLTNAGASPRILDAIEENLFQDLYFTFPGNGNEIGRIIRVEGWSKIFPGKHLWVFVRRKAEVNWVPQDNDVVPDPDGAWKHVVFLGAEKESNLNFEIKAVWVDSKSHRDLLSHVQSRCKDEKNQWSDRCPGIRFPEGDPIALVTVRRSN